MVARQLLGQVLAIRGDAGWTGGTIVETEAYLGVGDPASHSHRGPTPRSAIMFGPPGVAYVYFIYGMYHCLNAVTEPEGRGAAVLLRALVPMVPAGVGVSPVSVPPSRLRGPGLLCRELGVTLVMNGWDLASSDLRIFAGEPVPDDQVRVGARVGINRARELPLSFRVVPEVPGPGPTRRSGGRRPSR
jgi:DNA-3-methyladenine glycosylase